MSQSNELETALSAAQAAGGIQRNFLLKNKDICIKDDRSPVTQVDKQCEETIFSIISKKFPADGFLGEESGTHSGSSGRTWIVDPLDGTRPYIRGIPTYSVLIALLDGEEPVIGVAHLPGMNLTAYASKGDGAFVNKTPVRVSATSQLDQAICSGFGFIEKQGIATGQALMKCMSSWDYAYGFMDVYTYICIAEGKLDGAVNLLDKAWDCASAACIVREAGGRFSDLHGTATVHSGNIILSNGILHDQLLDFFD